MTLLKHELRINYKTLLIWTLCVGLCCFACLLLFESMEDTIDEMAGMYAQMGAFSTALGLDKISISTIEGFYATEVALVFALGGAMFAAMTGASLLSKEEEGHTAEFLGTLPLGRGYIVWWKYVAMVVLVILFSVGCMVWILLGFAGAGQMPPVKEFLLYHGAQLFMQLELGSICFLISAICKRRQTGAALGLAVLLYMAELMCRIVPDIENLKYVTPYYYSNAADIFTKGKLEVVPTVMGVGIMVLTAVAAGVVYRRRDLAA